MPDKFRGLYLHIPFCSVKCYFCDFTAFSGQNLWQERYLRALEKELSSYSHLPTQTLYIGGGTPTELSLRGLERLGRILQRAGRLQNMQEASCEAHPGSLSREKLSLLYQAGIRRLSIGLQSSEDHLLKLAGRRHDHKSFLKAYETAREAGFSNVNVDLIYGLPGQDLSGWKKTLRQVASLAPEHISAYGLQVEEKTLLYKKGVPTDPDLAAAMYERAQEVLSREGYRQYELSNFAKPGYACRHNLLYWTGEEYLGIGCGASSYISGTRWSNASTLPDYCGRLERGERPVAFQERLAGKAGLGEGILLRLRTREGVRWNDAMEKAFAHSRRRLLRWELLEANHNRLRLTSRGMLLANQVFREFVPPF